MKCAKSLSLFRPVHGLLGCSELFGRHELSPTTGELHYSANVRGGASSYADHLGPVHDDGSPTHDEILPDFTSDELALFDFIFRTLPIRESATTVSNTFAPGDDALLLIQSRMFGMATGDRKFHKWAGDYASDATLSSMVRENLGKTASC
jgi:hypothetical protein